MANTEQADDVGSGEHAVGCCLGGERAGADGVSQHRDTRALLPDGCARQLLGDHPYPVRLPCQFGAEPFGAAFQAADLRPEVLTDEGDSQGSDRGEGVDQPSPVSSLTLVSVRSACSPAWSAPALSMSSRNA